MIFIHFINSRNVVTRSYFSGLWGYPFLDIQPINISSSIFFLILALLCILTIHTILCISLASLHALRQLLLDFVGAFLGSTF